MEYIVTFHTHFDALQYDRFLKKSNIKGKLQPVPRTLSSSCGTCVKFQSDEHIEEDSEFTAHEFEKIFVKEGKIYILMAEKE